MISADEPWVMRLIKVKSESPEGQSTSHDGRFLKEYDPSRRADNLIRAHLVTTEDPREALKFTSPAEVLAVYQKRQGPGAGGLGRQPLATYTVEVLPYSDAIAEYDT